MEVWIRFLEFMSDNNYSCEVIRLGIPDTFIHHGTQKNYIRVYFDVNALINLFIN